MQRGQTVFGIMKTALKVKNNKTTNNWDVFQRVFFFYFSTLEYF